MSATWLEMLLQPIAADQPCGANLEDTPDLSSFDSYRLFGQAKPLDAPPDAEGNLVEKWTPRPASSPEWLEIRDKALELLAKSKDLRLLSVLGTAVLRTDGVPAFSDTVTAASDWLDKYWTETYPSVEEDAILRRSALNCFADPMAVVDGLRRLPLVSSKQHGTFSLRDIEVATQGAAPGKDDPQVDPKQVEAAFASKPIAELKALYDSTTTAVGALRKIDTKMRDTAGTEATPSFEPLTALLVRMTQALRVQLAAHPEGAAIIGDQPVEGGAGDAPMTGVVKSRQDAVRALDAVADFFRRTEPSSPVPMFLERAKRLVSKSFLEVLEDVAPEALAQARAAGGVKEGE